jgi:HlyD family secretion protein
VDNGRHSVTVLDGDTSKAVNVEVGAVGSTWTAITSGLSGGETVVVADLDEPLPSSATSSSNGQQQNPFGGQGRNGGAFVTRVN